MYTWMTISQATIATSLPAPINRDVIPVGFRGMQNCHGTGVTCPIALGSLRVLKRTQFGEKSEDLDGNGKRPTQSGQRWEVTDTLMVG